MVRCFVGFLLPEFLKDKIVSIQEEIKQLPIECKPVERENLHINFSFLGEVEDSKVEWITRKLEAVCTGIKPIKATIDELRLIPNENFIRVVVLEVISNELQMLTERIRREIGGDTKPLHVTLCRIKKIDDKSVFVKRIKQIRTEKVEFLVDSICLIKSELKNTGPIYTVIYEKRL